MSLDIKIPGFTLIKEIGAGGMATVYLAEQTLLERKVAIKVLHQRLSAESEEFKKRFFYEGKVLAKLQHDNIVSIIDIGEADGLLYMAMEYVEGGTLADWLKEKQLTVDQAIQICSKTALALHATHMKNIVHRDLKPSNILLRDIYTPLLTDFGIARATDVDQGLTQTGHIVGTLQYMSPEQIRGLQVDHRSDIYSLGLMFYRLLTGRLPFLASGHYELSRMQCEEPPPPLPPELAPLQGVIDAMLAKDPDDRFDSCLDFCRAVQNVSLTNEDFATELTQATRVYDSSQMGGSTFGTGRHSGSQSKSQSQRYSDRYSDRYSGSQSGQYTDRGTARTSGQYEQTRVTGAGQGQSGNGKVKKFAILGGVAAVVLALSTYFFFFFETGPNLAEGDLRRMTSILRRVNASIDNQRLEEAFKRLQDAKKIAADHPDVISTAEALAAQYELDAMDLLESGNLEGALEAIRKGLETYPEFPALIDLEQDVGAQFSQRENRRIISEALQLAAGYEAQGALVLPPGENAMEQYDRVIAIDEFNQPALAGLSAIETTLAEQIRAMVAAGDLAMAQQQLDVVAEFYQGSSVFNDIRQGIIETQRAVRELLLVTELLADAQKSMDQGRLIEPESDSALYYFNEVLNLNRNDPDARRGLNDIAAIYLSDANQAISAGNFESALQIASNGLRAQRDHKDLLEVQRMATSELGEVEQQIQTTLQRATRLVQAASDSSTTEIRTAAGVHENLGAALLEAKSGFEEVLALKPENADAKRGLATLATTLYNGTIKLQRSGKFEQAKAVLASAGSIPADQERFTQLSASLDSQIQQRDLEGRRRELVRLAESAIAIRPMTNESIDRAAATISDVRSEFPSDASLSRLVRDLSNTVASEAGRVSQQGSDAAALLIVDKALGHFASNTILIAARTDIVNTRKRRAEEERKRIAAISGQLAIDAMPWGVISEIRKQDGSLVPLQGEAQTPFVLTLTEGAYTVMVRSDSGVESTQRVNVLRQQLVQVRADYDLISADDYFEKSGW